MRPNAKKSVDRKSGNTMSLHDFRARSVSRPSLNHFQAHRGVEKMVIDLSSIHQTTFEHVSERYLSLDLWVTRLELSHHDPV